MKYYFQCPKCGSDEQFVKPSERSSGLGWALFFFGGFIPFLLFASHNQGRIQCSSCSNIFRQPPVPSNPLAKFAGWLLFLTAISVVVAIAFLADTDSATLLPSVPVIAFIEDAVTVHPRVAAYLLVLLFTLVVLPCWAAIWLSNARSRKELAAKYRLKALSSHELEEKNRRPTEPLS